MRGACRRGVGSVVVGVSVRLGNRDRCALRESDARAAWEVRGWYLGGSREGVREWGMFSFEFIERDLGELSAKGLFRDPGEAELPAAVAGVARAQGKPFVNASSNDYLGYASNGCLGDEGECASSGAWLGMVRRTSGELGEDESHLVSRETLNSLSTGSGKSQTAVGELSTQPQPGAGASRLLGGSKSEHAELEQVLASWVGQEEALLFSSGYAANVGLLGCLPREGDTIFSDELNHASIVDGCRLSRAAVVVYPHLDRERLAWLLANTACGGHRYIVTESYFSMEADSPNLKDFRAIADNFSAGLIVDEAHALGVFGPCGAGLATQCDVLPDITIGTLGKAVGLQGAFVASSRLVRSWLWNRARSFVYSTASTPVLAGQTLLHVKHIQRNDLGRARLTLLAANLRRAAADLGIQLPAHSHGPIVPAILGENSRATSAAEALRARGILAFPVRPPTVPMGTERVRLTVTAAMSDAAFSHLIESLAPCFAP
jgi:8-amino-7-oxononanoate synthase